MFATVDSSVSIYNLDRGSYLKLQSKYSPKPGAVIKQISWCHDNSHMAILAENEFPEMISTKDPNQISVLFTVAVPEVTALNFNPNTKRFLALGTQHGEIILYDTKHRDVYHKIGQVPYKISFIEFVSNNELVVMSRDILAIVTISTACDSLRAQLVNPDVGTAMKSLNWNRHSQIVVGCLNGMVAIWDIETGNKVATYAFHSAEVSGIAVSNKDNTLITTGADSKICIIDISTQKCVFRKSLHQPITSVDVSSSGQHLVVGIKDGSIYLYQMHDHLKPQICFKMLPSPVNQISFVNGLSTIDSIDNDSSFLEETNECEEIVLIKENDNNMPYEYTPPSTTADIRSPGLSKHFPDPPQATIEEVPEEKLKLDLMKLVNDHFIHLEEQLADHCKKFQTLVSSELDSLYSVAARWECFKTMEMEEILGYICGVVGASSETKMLYKSEHTNLQNE